MKKIIRYKSVNIGFSDQGKDFPVILVHGYLETSETWNSIARKLSEKFRVISVDLPGHGNSGIYGEVHTMEFMAEILRELISGLKLAKVFLAGHSLGGYVTLAFAELYPELLSGYCLFHSQPFADTEETLKKRENEIGLALSGEKESFYKINIRKMYADVNLERLKDKISESEKTASGITPEAIAAVLRGMMIRPSRVSVMEKDNLPCLWILGARDNYINCDLMRIRVSLPGNSKVVILENSGHMGFVEEEEKSLDILTDFISSLNNL